jgi:hypothetical protein
MSTLLIDELFSGVVFSQDLVVKRDIGVKYIRPWIYKQGIIGDGQLACRVFDNGVLLKEVFIDHTTINENITATYAHGFIRFDMEPLVLLLPDRVTEKTFTIEFEMVNHTTDVSNFIAINRSWENKIYDTAVVAPNDAVEPAGIEIYEIKEKL